MSQYLSLLYDQNNYRRGGPGIPNLPAAEAEFGELHCKLDLGGFELPYSHFKKRL
jgi:hypothetical protein